MPRVSNGEGKRRNEFAEWHVAWLAEWYNYVECNICRMTQRNKLKCVLFWRQSICKRRLCFNVNMRWQSKSQEGSLSISLFRTATKILLAYISRAAWQHRYYSTKVGYWRWRTDVLEGHNPFYLKFFLQKMFARLTLQFPFTYICICNRVGTVSFSDGGLRDRDIILRDENESCILFP